LNVPRTLNLVFPSTHRWRQACSRITWSCKYIRDTCSDIFIYRAY